MSVELDSSLEVETQAIAKPLHSDADSDVSMLAFVPPIPPSLPKFVRDTLFTACLNWADFFSDWYVVLQYACVIDSSISVGCGSGELQACEAHPWWFAMGVSLLVVSNLFQSLVWTMSFVVFLCNCATIKDRLSETRQYILLNLLLALLAFAQLHYLLDIAAACIVGAPDPTGVFDARVDASRNREVTTKILESGPQLYLQSYILFAVGSHGDPMKLASVAISVLAIGHGLLKENTAALSKPVYGMITFLWISSDQALRSAGYALVLARGARPYGITLTALAAVASCGLHIRIMEEAIRRERMNDELDSYGDPPSLACRVVVNAVSLFFSLYLVPAVALSNVSIAVPSLLVRWVEMAACALLAYTFATTNCGHAPAREVLGLLGLLVFNVLCYLIRYFCFDHKTGDFLCFGRGALQKKGGQEGPKDLATGPSATPEAAAASRKLSTCNIV